MRTWLVFLAAGVFLILAALAALKGNAIILVVGALAAIGLLAPFWRRTPRYLLFVLVLYLPFEDGLLSLFHSGVTAARVIPDGVLLAAFCWRAGLALWRRERFFGRALDLPIALLVVGALISMVLNHIPPSQAVQGPYTMIRYAMVFYLAAASQFELRDGRFLVRALVWVGVVECAVGVLQFVLLNGTPVLLFGDQYVQGTMSHFNVLAGYLAIVGVITAATYTVIWTRHAGRNLVLLLALFCLVIALAVSRQSVIAFGIGLVAIVVIRRWSAVRDLLPAAASSVAGFLVGFFSVKFVATWITRISTAIAHISPRHAGAVQTVVNTKVGQLSGWGYFTPSFYVNNRLYEIVNAAPIIWRRSALFGLGPGTFGSQPTLHDVGFYSALNVGLLVANPDYNFAADVGWMNVFGQLGLLGLAGFLWIFYAIGRIGYRAWRQARDELTRRLGLACVALVPMYLFLGLYGPVLELRQISILLWFLPGLVLSLCAGEAAAVPAAEASTPMPASSR